MSHSFLTENCSGFHCQNMEIPVYGIPAHDAGIPYFCIEIDVLTTGTEHNIMELKFHKAVTYILQFLGKFL